MCNSEKLTNSISMLRPLLLLSAIFLSACSLFAQADNLQQKGSAKKLLFDERLIKQNADYDKFVASAGELSNLYRGAAPVEYRFKYTGTYFAYSDNYEKGNILYDGRIYKNVLLNLNAHNDDLQIKIEKSGLFVTLNKAFVQSFTIGKHKFVNIGRQSNIEKFTGDVFSSVIEGMEVSNIDNLLPSGYYEIVYDGNLKLLKKTHKTYSERINQSGNAESKTQIERIFSESVTYFLIKEKLNYKNSMPNEYEAIVIKRKSALISQMKSKRSEVRQFVRKSNIDYTNKDLLFRSILEFYESSFNNFIK